MNAIAATIRTVDAAIKRIERKAKPMYWCQMCELALHQHEADVQRVTDAYEFWGERGTYETVEVTCGACGCDLEDYNYQDDCT